VGAYFSVSRNVDHVSSEEQSRLWLDILDFLPGCLPANTYLSLPVFHSIMVTPVNLTKTSILQKASVHLSTSRKMIWL
jgi:hypothetical protein